MIAGGRLALASGIALARPWPLRPNAVPRQRPHRRRCAPRSWTCRARPRRSHRSPCSLTLAATVLAFGTSSTTGATLASCGLYRYRYPFSLGFRGGNDLQAPSPALRAVLGHPAPSTVALADARAGRARRFPLAVPCRTPCERRNREPPHDPEDLFNLRGGDARQRDAPASPVAASTVAHADRDGRLHGNECAAISRSPPASR